MLATFSPVNVAASRPARRGQADIGPARRKFFLVAWRRRGQRSAGARPSASATAPWLPGPASTVNLPRSSSARKCRFDLPSPGDLARHAGRVSRQPARSRRARPRRRGAPFGWVLSPPALRSAGVETLYLAPADAARPRCARLRVVATPDLASLMRHLQRGRASRRRRVDTGRRPPLRRGHLARSRQERRSGR